MLIKNRQIKDYIEQAVCEVIGIDGLYGGSHEERQPDGRWFNKYNIEYLWISTLRDIWWTDVTLGVAKIHYKQDAVTIVNGFLFVEEGNEGSFQGKRPFHPIKLEQFDDPVIPLLQQFNLLSPVRQGPIPDDPESSGSFEIHTFAEDVFTSVSFNQASLPRNNNGILLWETLIILCSKFSHLNNEPEITKYIELKRGFR